MVISQKMEDTNVVGACGLIVAALLRKKRNNKRKRRNRTVWVRDWIKNRPKVGAYNCLIQELKSIDTSSYRNFLRMDVSTFEELFTKVAPLIARQDTRMREAISAGERLAVTLRFLATGKYVHIQ